MNGHHVIDDFNDLLKTQVKDRAYVDAVRCAASDLKQAQHFYLGVYQDHIQPLKSFAEEQRETQVFLGNSSKYVRLPYKTCWFEFEDKSFSPGTTLPVPKRGLLVHELDKEFFRVVTANWIEQYRKWMLTPQCYLVLVGKTFNEDFGRTGKKIADAAAKRGASAKFIEALLESNTYPLQTSDNQSWDVSMGLRADDQRDLYVLNAALLLLNCKNVGTEDNPPPPKLNKKRSKNGKQELFTYKTLILKLPATRQGPHSGGDGSAGNTKIHLCRGHLKIFTEDAPMFGKYTGLYWWDAHLRGDKSKGILVKDYAVKSTADTLQQP